MGPVLIKDSPANGARISPVLKLEPVDHVGLWGAAENGTSQLDSIKRGAVDAIKHASLKCMIQRVDPVRVVQVM